MRGLPRVLPQFPKSVLDRKLLPALVEEMKDRELLALVLQNIFQIVKMMPSGRRAFTEKIIPPLKEAFLVGGSGKNAVTPEKETGKEAGLMVLLENLKSISENCSGKEFKDGMSPALMLSLFRSK
jgi:SCY1-like protein 2